MMLYQKPKPQRPSDHLSDPVLFQLSEWVSAHMGLHFPSERRRDLERGMVSAAREFEFEDAESCARWLMSTPLTRNQIEMLASHLTVGETYFLRDKKSFELIAERILPELISARQGNERRLRIWSAGCCTGEEPYSIAILLSRMISDLRDWNVTILATDINPRFLQKAADGVYNEWSFRETPRWIRERYFKRRNDDRLEILPHLKTMVTFMYLNLAEDVYPSLLNNTNAMDIIFCRNVLMYFAPERAHKVVEKFFRALGNRGWLIVSPSETGHVLSSQFRAVNFPDAIFYEKEGKAEQAVQGAHGGRIEELPISFPPPADLIVQQEPESKIRQEPAAPPRLEIEERTEGESPYAKALALYERGCYAEAGEEIVRVLSQNQGETKAMALLARVYANQGKLAEARAWCEKAIATDKLNAGHYYLLASILQEQDQVDEAASPLRRALYLDQSFVLAHVALGNLAQRRGKLKQAEKHFENALSLLRAYRPEDVLPESEGMTAGRLTEIVRSTIYREQLV